MMLFLVLLLVTSVWAPSTAAQTHDLERAGATRILPVSDADAAALLNFKKRVKIATSDECVSPKNTLLFEHVYKNQETERIPWNAGKGDTDFRAALREYWRTKKLKMKMFKRKTKVKVLEVGCGQANDIKLVSMMGYTPTCVELSSTAVEAGKALKIPRASFVLGNVCTLQQMNQTYDIIYMRSVLSHVKSKGRMLDRLVSLLSADAKLKGTGRIMLKEWDTERMVASKDNRKAEVNNLLEDRDTNLKGMPVELGPAWRAAPKVFRMLFASKGLSIESELKSVCETVMFGDTQPLKCIFWVLKLAE